MLYIRKIKCLSSSTGKPTVTTVSIIVTADFSYLKHTTVFYIMKFLNISRSALIASAIIKPSQVTGNIFTLSS